MQSNSEIKRFVQETLGCSCPEEVFNKIDCQKESDGISGRKVNVGDRLLIYVINMDGKSNIQGVISSALERGVEERDEKDSIDSGWCSCLHTRTHCAARLNSPSKVPDMQMKKHTFML